MGNQRMSGLTKRGWIWHIDKVFTGTRIRESTRTGDINKAQELLAKRIDQIRDIRIYGVRQERTFREAATKFLDGNRHKRSIEDDAGHLKQIDPFIGDLFLRQVHMGSLQPFIAKRRGDGVKASTINGTLAITRHILNLAESEWMDKQGNTWLKRAPKIKLLPVNDARPAYPLAREEQGMLLRELPDYLAQMALFKANTGCREAEVCGLRWSYEVKVPELNTSVFIIPGDCVKNTEVRLVVLNRIARSVVEAQRGVHAEFVFVYMPKFVKIKLGCTHAARRPPRSLKRINTTAWRKARERAADNWEKRTGEPAPMGFRKVRVHDLKHTFGRRLRAAGVSFEDRQDLLGHKSGRITTHYSAAELLNLIAAAEKVCVENFHESPTSTFLRRRAG
jgi:integrase